MIYRKERFCFLYFLKASFLAPKMGYHLENQPVLRGYMYNMYKVRYKVELTIYTSVKWYIRRGIDDVIYNYRIIKSFQKKQGNEFIE